MRLVIVVIPVILIEDISKISYSHTILSVMTQLKTSSTFIGWFSINFLFIVKATKFTFNFSSLVIQCMQGVCFSAGEISNNYVISHSKI